MDWNSIDQSNEGEKEHIMHTVYVISLWKANQVIPFHVFLFSAGQTWSSFDPTIFKSLKFQWLSMSSSLMDRGAATDLKLIE